MEPFRVHVLGCGSAKPTTRHLASSQLVEIRGKLFMVDCGEGTQVQLRHTHVRFQKLGAIFISHLHGDHCFGLIGLISSFGLSGRTMPLHVYAPGELERMLHAMLELWAQGLEFEVIFHAVDTTEAKVIYEDKSLTVSTIPLEHRTACCGYLFREKPSLPHIRRDMIDFYHIPVSQILNIKNGADWVDEDGNVVANQQLVTEPDTPRAYAYCSDTRYCSTTRAPMTANTATWPTNTPTALPPRQPPWPGMPMQDASCWDITVHATTMKTSCSERQRRSSPTSSSPMRALPSMWCRPKAYY